MEIKNKYKALVESFSDLVFLLNREGRYIEVIANKEVLLVSKAEDLLGRTIFEVMPEVKAQELHSVITKTLKEGPQVAEYKLDVPAGERTFEGRTSVLRSEGAPFDEALVVWASRDITEKVEAEARQKELEAQLVQAQKMEAIAVTAGGVAHDLNNLLSSIVVYPDLIARELPQNSKLKGYLEKIKKAGEQSAAIVKDLLIMSRKSNRESNVLDLNKLVQEFLGSSVVEMLRKKSPNVNLQFRPSHQPVFVEGSSVHLSKVLMNLVINAFEALDERGEVSIRTYRSKDRSVILEVEDSGHGMSQEMQKSAFDPFVSDKKNGSSGSGLGLAVVWGVICDHGGKVSVESTEGEGACFQIELPIAKTSSIEERRSEPQSDTSNGYKRSRILVVDDFEDQREVLRDLIEGLGHGVEVASSGEQAIQIIKDDYFDLVLLDMRLGRGLDGLDTYKKILEFRPDQIVVIVTGHSENERLIEAKRLGVAQVLTKPVSYQEIKTVVESCVSSNSLEPSF